MRVFDNNLRESYLFMAFSANCSPSLCPRGHNSSPLTRESVLTSLGRVDLAQHVAGSTHSILEECV